MELKSCPFCGEKADYKVYKNYEFDTVIFLGCTNDACFCRIINNLGCAPKEQYIQTQLRNMVREWNVRCEE